MPKRFYIRPTLLTFLALAALAWAGLGLTFASLTTRPVLLHLFSNTHIEHFAAFYIFAALAVTAFPVFPLRKILPVVGAFAVILEIIRMFIPLHQLEATEDLFCDLAGICAVLGPMLIARMRAGFDAAGPLV